MKSPALFGAACAAVIFCTSIGHAAEEPAAAPAAAEPAAPAPEAAPAKPDEPASASADAASSFDTWLAQPNSNPPPPREDVEKYLGDLQKRQDDLGKILDFLVGKKRLKKEAAAKNFAAVALPVDLTMEKWDELNQKHQAGTLADADFTTGAATFASKLRALNLAEETLAHQCAQLMLQAADDDAEPVRRPRPKKPAATPAPAPAVATPVPGKPKR